MKNNLKTIINDSVISILILSLCFLACLILQNNFKDDTALIPSIFVLGAFLTSVITQGYIYGIMVALISVLAVNFAFTFPFFAFDFTIPENIISAIILLIVTVVTCGLTTKIKKQEAIKVESEKERMRANLLRGISHDLRTPLTTIYGSGSALLDNYENFSKEQHKQMLKGITEDAQWLTRMVENLLSVTKLDGNNVEIIKTNTALDELIDSILIKFSKRYPDNTVQVDIPEELVFIPMDAILIEQVILNILENAVQHAKGMTMLSLKVTLTNSKALFEIQDNGCGISENKLKTIFSGYLSENKEPSDNKKNAGIGLSVCSSIIKAHGGNITAHNSKKGGSVFQFVLNLEEENG